MRMNPKQAKWDLEITVDGVTTVAVREPTYEEMVALIELPSLSDDEICAVLRAAFSSLTGLRGDSISIEQAFRFIGELADYVAARYQPGRIVMGADRQWLLG